MSTEICRVAIMQPTFLPWSGYFNLIAQVQKFVFLDDVQFEKQSWQTRNRILFNGKETFLVVPTRKARLSDEIREIRIASEKNWRRKHWMTLQGAYSRAPFGKKMLELLEDIYLDKDVDFLSELNQRIIKRISIALGLDAQFFRASDLGCGGRRSAHLVEIIEALECNEYLSPKGSEEYMKIDGFDRMCGARLVYQQFVPKPYIQYRGKDFISHLSIVDVIANIGVEGARSYIL